MLSPQQFPTNVVMRWESGDFDEGTTVGDAKHELEPDKIAIMAKDIQAHGVRNPLHAAVLPEGQTVLYHGHHRAHGAAKAGEPTVPVVMHKAKVTKEGDVDIPTLDPALYRSEFKAHDEFWRGTMFEGF